ncbi:MAG TPA: SIS domain-containing protein, partial [candidate division Zixibacteria bacterium]|nr:SIS domain-containing protein [candidate division Zixibacteria bacterium]
MALDDIARMIELDPADMYGRIYDFPAQISDAQRIGAAWEFDANDFADIRNITIAGMGGSAIGGDLLRALTATELQVPLQVCRHYRLPEYIDDESLVIVSSYSGGTEETLAALDEALERKAMIIGITTGGALAERASQEG